ncbi:ribonuclease HII [Candidatus Falkowbacteria bacterium RIFOXYB2_FULL_34_18]|uniref:Ribonuclease HII n=1 Tax=Candidatus Falkowbacteria bacterium RIFOXYD2_FULL_34_120 TaxID=1798007 RepID=A0A1F5TNU6_9BACT|nr:MAG: ribonuclease HII [Candidatus Falkowbacteria bacterium RIFOXYB2_FULL_34_18]OGF28781.1 MAG: ribonuclease HII [Candidatus Falkowbacteria bacterium RIFOXYC12_FULL_34_55]OGF35714.1 MAG: ribonuclease HII [Candidatus Falkowbacteria bacterium RIFOXYC2_FULL_34_220]OGF38430.1 MAG: ribonuclease HII [Candidatus Falkowbacteria bacterium RIFOXYD12_FULL_34_57]OGF40484.1 MAG: ribonuclease HII [Candidatus Falkowbacteria bacterium RIFOXYD2_FULL_34_120]
MNLSEEKSIFDRGYRYIGGIDEAGRGPLAGPVVSACVVASRNFIISNKLHEVKDSKKLTERKREELFEEIYKSSLEVGIGICNHEIIDKVNILQATFLSMKKAITMTGIKPEFVLLDGRLPIPNLDIKQKTFIGGDNLVFLIAAASIIAKVTRDRLMKEIHNKYPEYGFEQHKGYGTKYHIENLQKYGPCAIHRKTFGPVKNLLSV